MLRLWITARKLHPGFPSVTSACPQAAPACFTPGLHAAGFRRQHLGDSLVALASCWPTSTSWEANSGMQTSQCGHLRWFCHQSSQSLCLRPPLAHLGTEQGCLVPRCEQVQLHPTLHPHTQTRFPDFLKQVFNSQAVLVSWSVSVSCEVSFLGGYQFSYFQCLRL